MFKTKDGKFNTYLVIGASMAAVIIILSLLSIFWTPYSPTDMSASLKFKTPSFAHIFGTDNFGRDIFSRVMKAIGTSFLISVFVVLISGTAGILIGSVTGYFGGIIDTLVMRVVDAINGFPSILLALVVISLLGKGRANVVLALAIAFTPSFVRIVRGEFIRLRDADYIVRARLMGARKTRILFLHILPNIFSTFWVSVMIGFNNAILAESGLSYLGLGVQAPDATLGSMLSDAQGYLGTAPWYALAPGLTIVWMVLSAAMLSEGIQRRRNSVR